MPSANLQRRDLLALESEHMLEFDRTAGKLAGNSADDHERAISFSRAERYNRVEYSLTDWGQALCPALDALLTWVDFRDSLTEHENDHATDETAPPPAASTARSEPTPPR
jgi:hypothetical protein